MKGNNYLYSLLTIIATFCLFSCSDQRAKSLKEQLDEKERKANDIVLSEKGTEAQKLDYIIAERYDSALVVTARQQIQFDSIIRDLEAFPADGLEGATEVKRTAVQYYQALQTLYGYSKKEVIQQQMLQRASADDQKELQDGLLTLAKQKQGLFENVYKAEADFSKANTAFEKKHQLTP